jgi:hypothetical protein
MPDYSVEQELVQFGKGSLTFLEPRFYPTSCLPTSRELPWETCPGFRLDQRYVASAKNVNFTRIDIRFLLHPD